MTSRWPPTTPTTTTSAPHSTTTTTFTATSSSSSLSLWMLSLLMILMMLAGASGSKQEFSVRPESVEVVEGGDVLLSCVVEHQQGKAQWTKDGFALGFERDVPGYPRFQYAGEPSLGEHHLAITGATLTEDGEYQCQVGPTSHSPPIWAAANVTVILPPTGVRIVGWGAGAQVEVLAGTALNLDCEVMAGRPAPRVAWLRDGAPLPPDLQEDSTKVSSEPRRWDTRSRLTVNTTPADDAVAFTCRALHPGLPLPPLPPPSESAPSTQEQQQQERQQQQQEQPPMEASVTLSVLHPPGAPMVSGYSPGEVAVAGERRTITCTSLGGNPRPWVLWYRDGNLLDDTTTTTTFPSSSSSSSSASSSSASQGVSRAVVNAHELVLTPLEDGALLECRVSNDLLKEPLTANVTLTVYYPPASVTIRGPAQVGAGDTLNLTCETSDSNPPASITWTVQGEVIENSRSVVAKDGAGGWVTSSRVSHPVGGAAGRGGSVKVECRALNPAVEQVVRRTTTVTITRPAGPPVFKSDLREPVVAGTMLDLTCVSVGGHPPPTLRVYKGEEEVATEVVVEAGVTEARVEVEVTAADNRKEVSCDVSSTATNATPQSTSATLSVQFPPWEVTGEVTPGTVEEGEVVTLSCESTSSLPASNITWTSTSASLHGAIVSTSSGAFGGTVTRSELHLSTTADDNGRTFQCEASNSLGVAVHQDLTLNVLHTPRWIVKPPEQLDVYEGAELVVTATALANPGPLRYWWRRGEETQEATKGELRLGKVGRHISGEYSVSAYNPRGAANASFTLNVQYAPEHLQAVERVTVGEGGAVTVECTAGGNPPPTLTWTNSGTNSTAHTLSSGVGIARLVVEEATVEHTGLYLCHASNVVASAPPVSTKVIVTQPPRVVVEAAGASGSWAALGGRGRLVCRVRAAPAPSFSWTTEHGLTLQSGPKYDLRDPQLVDGLVLWASVLEVLEVEKEDYSKYTCSANNALGSDSSTLALNPPARPHPPTNFTITNITSSTVSLAWVPNFTGGLPRGYIIRYRETGTIDHQRVELSGGNTAGTTLTGLTARHYLFTIRATNDQGASPFLAPPLLATLPEPDKGGAGAGAGRWRVPRLILVVMSLTGGSLLLLNIAIIACFVRRRARTRLTTGSPSTTKMEVTLDGYSGANNITSPHHSNSTSTTTTTLAATTTTTSPPPPPPPPPPLPQQQQHHLQQPATTTASTTLLLHHPHHHNRNSFQPQQHNNNNQQQHQQQQLQQVVFPLPAGGCQVEACDGGESEVGPHASPLQNGGPLRRGSITSFKGAAGGMNAVANGVRENGGVPCRERRGSGGGGGGGGVVACSGGGGGGAGGDSPYHHHHHHHHHLHPHHHHHHHNPEVCSLTSSTYDASPGLPTSASTGLLPQQEQRRGSDAATPDDQISLASFHSSHSRTYSQGYIRPLPPPGCPNYSMHPCQSRPCPQREPQSLPSSMQQGQSYASLNPSSLYSLSADYYEARCGQQQPSFSTGSAPLGYATLGPRSRRAPQQQPSQFSTLQRPRTGRLQARECQADCCDYEDDLHTTTQQRRSSFHGPLRRCDTPDTPDTQQQHSTRQPQQDPDDGGYGMTQQKQKQEDTGTAGRGRGLLGGPRGGGILRGGGGGGGGGYSNTTRSSQQDLYSRGSGNLTNSKIGSRDPIVAVPAYLIPNNNANNDNSTSSPPLPPPPPSSTFAASTSRLRFPHDYVRQGSTKKGKTVEKKK
ncbi:nephrin-like isoform X2 [Eriocheir sinensis]|uniref:nephrin-like isoform X2 n=1 Tax=Eriocheir sinensis TaxID=95602 RepID=UPI0021C984FA|nr:nephrin-like isoform X2 [Eriocheir sinensis]